MAGIILLFSVTDDISAVAEVVPHSGSDFSRDLFCLTMIGL